LCAASATTLTSALSVYARSNGKGREGTSGSTSFPSSITAVCFLRALLLPMLMHCCYCCVLLLPGADAAAAGLGQLGSHQQVQCTPALPVVQVSQPLRVQLADHQRQTQTSCKKLYHLIHRHRYVNSSMQMSCRFFPRHPSLARPLDSASGKPYEIRIFFIKLEL
jgi:hypothetical protein